jgi:hypothetical protein
MDEQRVDTVPQNTGSFTPRDSREDSGPTPVLPDFRKLAGYGALAALVAGLRAHDAQLDRSKGKLDTAQNAA